MGKIRNNNRETPKSILVDPEDSHLLSLCVWTIEKNYSTSYTRGRIRGKRVSLHRVILGAVRGQIVDHINGNGLDNRRENIRIATTSQNSMNSCKQSRKLTSKYKGVFYYKALKQAKRPWGVQIKCNKKTKFIGTYATELEAAQAYNEAALEHYGEFARLNKC